MTPTTRKIAPTTTDGAPQPLPLGQHIVLTTGLLVCVLVLAMVVPGVTVIWSLMGSSTAIIIAYVIPSACYVKIRGSKGLNAKICGAWVMLCLSVPLCIACTITSVLNVIK
jgi:hypothetical protein